MSTASSRVLLLGWNEVFPPQPAASAPLRDLVQQLAPLANLAVLLPHEPQPAFVAVGTNLRITGLAELDLAALQTAARPSPNPAAWQAPAAPYIGSSSPAAPYLGATPGVSAVPVSTVAPTAWPAAPEQPAALPAGSAVHPPVALVAPAATIPADRNSPAPGTGPDRPTSVEPSTAPTARATGQPRNEPAASAASTNLHPAPDTPPPPMRVHATLTQELAALGRNPPSATAADLNFQVIQYARFATSWASGRQFAVIYAVDWPTWLAAMEIRQLTGWPLVLHVHSLAQERATAAETGWAVALERLALRRADLVLASTAEVAGLLTERYQLPPERLQTIAVSNTAAINELLLHIEQHRSGRLAGPLTTSSFQ
ncbi:glycosyltransferase [Hymenobacter lapidiphilus]|uniref:Glycosyltransferase n=1 Tax=Hymenobacter lapidiphilus TaxID=2608003 RepID=A0A7Y7PQ29_9BACT|nr:glycosyltransferase [Hymenobacter lapidiphilus]NVO31956.1 glycosyltransferase [Hymenobacter lapidiphilus]